MKSSHSFKTNLTPSRDSGGMNTNQKPQLFHCLKYTDAPAAIDFLTALGFTEVRRYTDENDPTIVQHAELTWRDNGGVMLGSAVASGLDDLNEGRVHSAYLVVATDEEVDAAHSAALASGGRSVREPSTPDYGGRETTVADLEGHLWSVGIYPGS